MTSRAALVQILGRVCAAVALAGCGPRGLAPAAVLPTVTVAHPMIENARPALELTGVLAGSGSVDVVARVAGFVRAKGFRDGARVRHGQVLFRIEPDAYVAQLASSEAKAVQARAEYQRQLRLAAQDATARTNVESADASLREASASLRTAALNLSYTSVRAPFDGWAGPAAVDVGAYVGGGQATRLATIQKLDPIYVDFTIGERDVLRIKGAMRGSGPASARGASAYPVDVGLQGESDFPHHGVLEMAQKSLDSSTGSLQARAVLANRSEDPLLPGLFARVRIYLGPGRGALSLPEQVIQSDELGDFVYVAGADGVIQRRNVTSEGSSPGRRTITAGLAPADWVVVDGLANVRVGGKARVSRQAAAQTRP